MKLLSIGSVLCAKDKKAVVVGYHFGTEEDHFVTSYMIVDFPMGYINEDCIGIVPVDTPMEAMFEGYENGNYKSFIKNKEELYEASCNMTVSEWEEQLEYVQREAEKWRAENG